ncbi:MAG: YIP1 family protein [Candidatus Rokubacteria bacterium]|nr:YIP1 family protein [Candidatus Rokubacteria bacterium]
MSSSFAQRIVRAAKLDVHLYEEVEADAGATRQAMAVVALSSVAAGLGAGRWQLGGIVIGTGLALVGWVVWAYLTYWIGTRFLPEPQTRASHGELLRTIGFATSPGLIRVLGVIPGLRELAFLGAGIWGLIATVIAVRQALDYRSTLRAVGVCAVGWVVQMILVGIALVLVRALAGPA